MNGKKRGKRKPGQQAPFAAITEKKRGDQQDFGESRLNREEVTPQEEKRGEKKKEEKQKKRRNRLGSAMSRLGL